MLSSTLKKTVVLLSAILIFSAVASYFLTASPISVRQTPSIIRVGVLPDESLEILRTRYEPLLEYLSQDTGLEFQLILPSDYPDLTRLFRDREIDLAYFGGLTFVQMHKYHGAKPLVMRDIDTRFTSYFLVKSNSQARNLKEFEGKVFSFGNRLSTSGHLMPRYFIQQELNTDPSQFFSEVRFSGAHDQSAYDVRDGQADLAVANAQIIKGMYADGRLVEGDIGVLKETPPYPDYVWSVHEDMDITIQILLRDAFLKLDAGNDHHLHILQKTGAKNYMPAGVKQFTPLYQIADSLGLLNPGTD